MKLADDFRHFLRLLTGAPLISMLLPFVGTLFDAESKCRLTALSEPGDPLRPLLHSIYYLIPVAAGIYVFWRLRKKRFERADDSTSRRRLVGGLILINLLFPIALSYWELAAILALLLAGCYDIKIEIW